VLALSVKAEVLREDFLRLVLEGTKSALIDAQELASHAERLRAFDTSAHIPEKALLLEDSDYDKEYRRMDDYLHKWPDFRRKDVSEEYASFVGKIDPKDSGGAIFNLVHKGRGIHIRIILLRKPFNLSVLVHEILHIFEDYLGLQYGELARFSQSVAQHLNIKMVKRETKGPS
jgi:hypothetical protein